ncbi:MAG: PhnD/SsuA/transferrin family substrate-binding protein [Candidatus Latescibacteria bacterium]|nr:PhnD/SsuA/transferrin family substrate-binding protein [Candidatus Latescibacterota bacterium]NIM21598.1 PhnD/SsuA/transferrin family substrate-binding protein [Candidatus Latescibacterota bacterium]NIM64577.1 PhnD/SsuA/transferrin family substrate-binding protein [Candidatus Latescibacterota bacterium]NIO01092.1 PhnD/SsuA/transferrin family substrate-binding protein [Candidatus Latescibacterota bacterium]NIO27485.1 PhnD/SsuA/transferrin family substrate-binding protein [Candidatus Latesciba
MKNKANLIDYNILSSYMGKFLTLIVTLLVLGITISALIGGGRDASGEVLTIGIALEEPLEQAISRYEHLSNLIGSQTRQAVEVVPYSSPRETPDLYIVSLNKYLEIHKAVDLVPLFSVSDSRLDRDAAIIITADPPGEIDYGSIPASRVAFTDSISLNGFLVQLEMLESGGFRVPDRLGGLCFEGSAMHSARVIFGVQWGTYTLGACLMSDLLFFIGRGLLNWSEIRVVARAEALPETIIAVPREKVEYFTPVLEAVNGILASDNPPFREEPAVVTMPAGVERLAPVDDTQIERARELVVRAAARF